MKRSKKLFYRLECEWKVSGDIFNSISSALNRGHTRRVSILTALGASSDRMFRDWSRAYSLPFSHIGKDFEVKKNSALLSGLIKGTFDSLTARASGGAGFNFWHRTFLDLFRVERWIRQQSAQARVQCVFLVGFVPAVAITLFIFNWQRFFANVQTSQGQVILGIAGFIYLIGVYCLLHLLRVGHVRTHSRSLDAAGGRMLFLNDLLCAGGNRASKLSRYYQACLRTERRDVQLYVRKISLGLETKGGDKFSGRMNAAEEDYLMHLRAAYVESAQGNHQWLLGQQSQTFESFQAQCAQSAAVLSLKLLLPMGLFFLPALFLILALTGFSMGSDALNL